MRDTSAWHQAGFGCRCIAIGRGIITKRWEKNMANDSTGFFNDRKETVTFLNLQIRAAQIQDKNLKFSGARGGLVFDRGRVVVATGSRDTTRGGLNEARNILPGL